MMLTATANARNPYIVARALAVQGLAVFPVRGKEPLTAHGVYSAFQPGQLTAIPLAYGVFCAAFDFCMAAYFYARRAEWIAARKAVPQ